MKFTHIASLLLAASGMVACSTSTPETSSYLIVGSYSSADDEGIKVYAFDETTGQASYVSGLKGIENPSFVYPSADGTRVYAVGENFEEAKGSANALAFDAAKGTLALLNSQLTHGDAPCNIIVSPDEKWVYTSNYNGGSITEFPLEADGKLGEGRVIAFSGSSVDTLRQTQPHLHAVNFSPDGRLLLANDLGTDRVYVFVADSPLDTIQHCRPIEVPAGMGPRHLCFGPVREDKENPDSGGAWYAYLLGEISGDVIPLYYDSFEYLESCLYLNESDAVRVDSLGAKGCADIHISADGRFVYTSHRLQGDGLSILRVLDDGTLEKVGYQPTGVHPRNFTISPSGDYLLVACRDDNVVQIYRRDAESGLLTNTGHTIEMAKPVCLQWIE